MVCYVGRVLQDTLKNVSRYRYDTFLKKVSRYKIQDTFGYLYHSLKDQIHLDLKK